MFDQGLVHLCEWRVCLNHNPVLLACRNGFMLYIHWMNFELIDYRLNFGNCQQLFDMMSEEVRDTNEFDGAFLHVFLKRFP